MIDQIKNSENLTERAKAIEWFKSLPFVKARSLAINETGRFIREPLKELTGREIENIWSQHCG